MPSPSFSDCKDRNSIWWKRNDLIKEGFYYKNLLPYFELFPRENIKVYLYEELNENPEEVLRDIYRFLGVNEDFKGDLTIRYNQSGLIKNKFLDQIYGHHGVVGSTLKAILPKSIYHVLKTNSILHRLVYTLRGKNLTKPKMDHDMKRWLTREVYGNDIKNLQQLIGKDLSHWLKA